MPLFSFIFCILQATATPFSQQFKAASHVWQALFLREASSRLFGSRAAWAWLLLEPLVHILWLTFVFTSIRVRHIDGMNTALWIAVGMLVFLTFRRTLTRVQKSIEANKSLFTYRQVHPGDVVLVRTALEAVLMCLIAILVMAVGYFLGWSHIPVDAFALVYAFVLALFLGMGLGLVFAVFSRLLPDIDSILGFVTMPLMIVSGVIFPISRVPEPYLSWLMLNPLAHAVDLSRVGMSDYYRALPHLSVAYVSLSAIVLLFLGLLLLRYYNERLLMR